MVEIGISLAEADQMAQLLTHSYTCRSQGRAQWEVKTRAALRNT